VERARKERCLDHKQGGQRQERKGEGRQSPRLRRGVVGEEEDMRSTGTTAKEIAREGGWAKRNLS